MFNLKEKLFLFLPLAMIGWTRVLVLVALILPTVMALNDVKYGVPRLKRGLTGSEKKHILELHNMYRELTAKGKFFDKPPAANMMKLVSLYSFVSFDQVSVTLPFASPNSTNHDDVL